MTFDDEQTCEEPWQESAKAEDVTGSAIAAMSAAASRINHLVERVNELCYERDSLKEQLATLPPAVTGETSDGYHTFNELYDHRITLWIALCRKVGGAWRTERHSDFSKFDGWFVLGMGHEPRAQITYHLPLSRWQECEFAETRGVAPEFDGHTSSDVLKRIAEL